MYKIGLTGGIASGKTSVAKWFRDKGITVVDSDRIVHEQYTKPNLIARIKQTFGQEYFENGVPNRTLLADTVFKFPEAKMKLEEILHPLVREEINRQCLKLERQQEKVIILDIPLLFEVGWESSVDEIWVVYVPPATQIERLMLRNGLTEKEAGLRISSQMSLDEKIKKAKIVIDNSGDWGDTEKKLLKIWEELEQRL